VVAALHSVLRALDGRAVALGDVGVMVVDPDYLQVGLITELRELAALLRAASDGPVSLSIG